ncbi:hypothetical protein [Streptomyces sp. NPDC048106]|uniref:hypothetical protein n=1 Tax=Streptomyces sp. NPDC048106 TaxID=3155750 RepID=UPI003455A3AE
MRLRTSLSPGRIVSPRPLGLAAAATLATLAAAPAAAPVPLAAAPAAALAVGATPTLPCAVPGERTFPLTTRIRGGPTEYRPGGGYRTWYIDLTNTTHRSCADIHPVVVLVDDRRELKPGKARLDFHDGSRIRPVTFESTDEKELVGVLDAPGFGGFDVPSGKTVSVRVRLALTRDAAVPDQVTAHAAAVQRRGRDGDWAGESNAYRFGIGTAASPVPEQSTDQDPDADRTPVAQDLPGTDTGTDTDTGTSTGAGAGAGAGVGAGTRRPQAAGTTGTGAAPSDGPPAAAASPSLPFARDAQEAGERARELARTGSALTHGLLAAAGVLLCVSGAAFLTARRRR